MVPRRLSRYLLSVLHTPRYSKAVLTAVGLDFQVLYLRYVVSLALHIYHAYAMQVHMARARCS